MSSIRVLSYNVSWESLEPKPNWNIDKNIYAADKKGDGKIGLGYMCWKEPGVEVCRNNIFNVLAKGIKGKPYDLIGMQEYVPRALDSRIKTQLPNMQLVKDSVPLKFSDTFTKLIDIASMFNKKRFTLIQTIKGEFLIRKEDWNTKEVTWNSPDGRPYLILILQEIDTGNHIIFINAHMPQTRNIQNQQGQVPQQIISNTINLSLEQIDTEILQQARIILATDSNDCGKFCENYPLYTFINQMSMVERGLHMGRDLRKTCCSSKLLKNGLQLQKPPMHRYGDVILDSESADYQYIYPSFKEPSSDHLPIAAILNGTGKKKSERSSSKTSSKKSSVKKKNNRSSSSSKSSKKKSSKKSSKK